MSTIEKEAVVSSDGSLIVIGVPFKPGDIVMVSLRRKEPKKRGLTAAEILASDFTGSWEGRTDIADSPEYARSLRESVEKRDWSSGDAA